MLRFLKKLFTENMGLKLMALLLALTSWFYIVKELNRGSEEDMRFLQRILPSEAIVAKKLVIKPIFVGRVHSGFAIPGDKILVVPDYCIVVGTKDMLEKIRFAYTMPIDVGGISRSFTKSVPLNPIAPGVYMEETLVQVTVPVEKTI